MRSIINTVTLSVVGALVAAPAWAGIQLVRVPEPGMIGLFAAGAVAVILLKCRK